MSVTLPEFKNCLFENSLYEEEYKIAEKTIWIRALDIDQDLELIHSWMNRPHVSEFWDMAWSVEKIRKYLEDAKKSRVLTLILNT